jgi:hypothetical protein
MFPGSWIRIWHLNSQGYYNRAANAVGITPASPREFYEETGYSGTWDFPGDCVRTRVWGMMGKSAVNDWWSNNGWENNYSNGRCWIPFTYLFRVDALFKPPVNGRWQFQPYGNDRGCRFSIGAGVSDPMTAFDNAPTRASVVRGDWWAPYPAYWTNPTYTADIPGMDVNLYYPVSLYESSCCWSGVYNVSARLVDAVGNPDPTYGNVKLGPSNLFVPPP